MNISDVKLQQELSSCEMSQDLVMFLLNLLKCNPLSEDDIVKFTKQKGVPNTRIVKKNDSDSSKNNESKKESEGPILELEREGKSLNALNNIALALLQPGINASYNDIEPFRLTIKQTATECIFDEITLNGFYKEIFPNIETKKQKVKSTLTILLPTKQAVNGPSTWDLYNLTDKILGDSVSDDIKGVRKFRLTILLILLKIIKRKNNNHTEDKLTTELIDRLSLPLQKVDDIFFALKDELTKKIVGNDDAKVNTLLNFMLSGKDSYKMDTFNVVTVSKTNNKHKEKENQTNAKDLAEVNRAEQGACWGLGYFLATLDGVAIKIELKQHKSYPVRNIIIAPKVITDTLKQIQPYRSNYLTGAIEYDEKTDDFLHHKPYHSNTIPRIGEDPQSDGKFKTSIAKSLLTGSEKNEASQDDVLWEETDIPGVKRQVSAAQDTLVTQSLIYYPVYLPPFLNSRT